MKELTIPSHFQKMALEFLTFWYIFASLEAYDILLSSITTLKIGAVREYNYLLKYRDQYFCLSKKIEKIYLIANI